LAPRASEAHREAVPAVDLLQRKTDEFEASADTFLRPIRSLDKRSRGAGLGRAALAQLFDEMMTVKADVVAVLKFRFRTKSPCVLARRDIE